MAMLGNVIELTVVVRDLEAAIERYTKLFGLEVHTRGESKEFGFLNAILPTLVPREDLPGAVALASVQMNLSRVIGPPIGALIYHSMSAAPVAKNSQCAGL